MSSPPSTSSSSLPEDIPLYSDHHTSAPFDHPDSKETDAFIRDHDDPLMPPMNDIVTAQHRKRMNTLVGILAISAIANVLLVVGFVFGAVSRMNAETKESGTHQVEWKGVPPVWCEL